MKEKAYFNLLRVLEKEQVNLPLLKERLATSDIGRASGAFSLASF